MLDVVRERKPRFVPAQVIAEYAELLKLYGISEIQGDKYAIVFHEGEWRTHGIKSPRANGRRARIICTACRCCWLGVCGWSTA